MNNGQFEDEAPSLDIAPGRFIVAAPGNEYGFLQRSVQLIFHCENSDDESVAYTVVLGRMTDIPLQGMIDAWAPLAGKPHAFFHGGRSKRNAVIALATGSSLTDPLERCPSVGLLQLSGDPEALMGTIAQARFFMGINSVPFSTLKEGIAEGHFRLMDARPDLIFAPRTTDVWRECMRALPGTAPLWSTFTPYGEN